LPHPAAPSDTLFVRVDTHVDQRRARARNRLLQRRVRILRIQIAGVQAKTGGNLHKVNHPG
jgi:hypothetical protein